MVVFADDQVSGVSVCCRERDDIIQIWNVRADREKQSTIMEKAQSLVPSVKFSAAFYKREQRLLFISVGWRGKEKLMSVEVNFTFKKIVQHLLIIMWFQMH